MGRVIGAAIAGYVAIGIVVWLGSKVRLSVAHALVRAAFTLV